MATLFKSEKSARISAIEAARNALLERAEKDPVRTMDGFLANPQLITGKVQDFDKIVKILLEKGQQEKLKKLAQSPKVGAYAKTVLTKTILNSVFVA